MVADLAAWASPHSVFGGASRNHRASRQAHPPGGPGVGWTRCWQRSFSGKTRGVSRQKALVGRSVHPYLAPILRFQVVRFLRRLPVGCLEERSHQGRDVLAWFHEKSTYEGVVAVFDWFEAFKQEVCEP